MQVVSGRIGHERVHFTTPPREVLELEADRFLAWFNGDASNSATDLDGLIRAGLAHLWFVTLHPFEDGNGRLARAITDWLAWFLVQVEASATAAEKTFANTLAKARFWLRHQTTDINERQRKALNRLLDAGRDGFEDRKSVV